MALGIGTDRLITLGRQATGDGVITTDIGTTVTTGMITDGGGKLRHVRLVSADGCLCPPRVFTHLAFQGGVCCRSITYGMLEANAISNAKFYSRSDDSVIRVYDDTDNAIETHERAGDFKEC